MRINRLTNVALQIRSNVLKLNNLRSIRSYQGHTTKSMVCIFKGNPVNLVNNALAEIQ